MFVLKNFDRRQWPQLSKLIGDRLEAEGAAPGDEERFDWLAARTRLPMWLWAHGPEVCARVFSELWCYARDGYEHEPSAIQREAMYWSLVAYRDDTDDLLDKDLDPLQRERAEEELATIDQLINQGLGKTFDFIHLDVRVNALLQGENSEDLRGFPFQELMGLIPPDLRGRVEQVLKNREVEKHLT